MGIRKGPATTNTQPICLL